MSLIDITECGCTHTSCFYLSFYSKAFCKKVEEQQNSLLRSGSIRSTPQVQLLKFGLGRKEVHSLCRSPAWWSPHWPWFAHMSSCAFPLWPHIILCVMIQWAKWLDLHDWKSFQIEIEKWNMAPVLKCCLNSMFVFHISMSCNSSVIQWCNHKPDIKPKSCLAGKGKSKIKSKYKTESIK